MFLFILLYLRLSYTKYKHSVNNTLRMRIAHWNSKFLRGKEFIISPQDTTAFRLVLELGHLAHLVKSQLSALPLYNKPSVSLDSGRG
jgi:hypothetical protein